MTALLEPVDPLTTPASALPALITGASSGIGTDFARELAARGHPLVLVARTRDVLHRLAASLPVPARVLVADLTTAEGLARVEAAVETVGLLVNNAGAATHGGLGTQTSESLERSVLLNVLAPTRLTAAAVRVMRPGSGIINVSSTAVGRDDPALAAYAASKAYLESFSRSARREGAFREVSVTVVRPGRTRTAFHERAGERCSHLPAWRWQSPREVVLAALAAHDRGDDEVTVAPSTPS